MVAGEFGAPSQLLNTVCANTMVSMHCKTLDVAAATAFWREMLSGAFGAQIAIPSNRAITSMLRLFNTAACPVPWMVGLLRWFERSSVAADGESTGVGALPASFTPLIPDSHVVTAAVSSLARRRQPALITHWLHVLLSAVPALATDRFVIKETKAALGETAASEILAKYQSLARVASPGKPAAPKSVVDQRQRLQYDLKS